MTKTENLLIRMTAEEKDAFRLAAELSGIKLSAWIRERLRKMATAELEAAGLQVPFYKLSNKDE
jgi:uncharacterized protein (DUF1778 family)